MSDLEEKSLRLEMGSLQNQVNGHLRAVQAEILTSMWQSLFLYTMGHDLICDLSDYFVQRLAYDIGCSTGTLTYRLVNIY